MHPTTRPIPLPLALTDSGDGDVQLLDCGSSGCSSCLWDQEISPARAPSSGTAVRSPGAGAHRSRARKRS